MAVRLQSFHQVVMDEQNESWRVEVSRDDNRSRDAIIGPEDDGTGDALADG